MTASETTHNAEGVRPKVVRPNRYDVREKRLADDLERLVNLIRQQHPETFDGPDTLATLNIRTAVCSAERELAMPMMSDLDGRVRHPVIRWWREAHLDGSGEVPDA